MRIVACSTLAEQDRTGQDGLGTQPGYNFISRFVSVLSAVNGWMDACMHACMYVCMDLHGFRGKVSLRRRKVGKFTLSVGEERSVGRWIWGIPGGGEDPQCSDVRVLLFVVWSAEGGRGGDVHVSLFFPIFCFFVFTYLSTSHLQ